MLDAWSRYCQRPAMRVYSRLDCLTGLLTAWFDCLPRFNTLCSNSECSQKAFVLLTKSVFIANGPSKEELYLGASNTTCLIILHRFQHCGKNVVTLCHPICAAESSPSFTRNEIILLHSIRFIHSTGKNLTMSQSNRVTNKQIVMQFVGILDKAIHQFIQQI